MDSRLPPDPYKALGVAKDAKLPEIRSAHRKLVLQCHPDKVQDAALKAIRESEFQKVQAAYELLSDDTRRIEYDERVKLFQLRKEMGIENSTQRSNPFEYDVKTPKPHENSYARTTHKVYINPNVLPKLHDLYEKPRRHRLKRMTGAYWDACTVEEKRRRKDQAQAALPRLAKEEPEEETIRQGKLSKSQDKRAGGSNFAMGSEEDFGGKQRLDTEKVRHIFKPEERGSFEQTEHEEDSRLRQRSGKESKGEKPENDISGPFASLPFKNELLLKIEAKPLGKWNIETRRPFSRPREKPTGILVVRGHVNGREAYAIPDTGAETNIMAASFAGDLGLTIQDQDSSQSQLLRMANGKHIETAGTAQAIWSFESDPSKSWRITFQILSDFVYDLVLGASFLGATQTMSHHQHRLCRVPRLLGSLSILRVNVLGCTSQRVSGNLQGDIVQALPDSGSEPNLMSLEYVERREWLSKVELQDQRIIQFADGSIGRTEGSILRRWRFRRVDDDDPETSLWVKFHILRGCVYSVILGQDVLEETNAFLRHEKAFLEIASNSKSSGLNLVIWLSKTRQKRPLRGLSGTPTGIQATPHPEDEELHTELQRRAASDRRISRIPSGNERRAAIAVEIETRRNFDTRHPFTPPIPRNSQHNQASTPPIPALRRSNFMSNISRSLRRTPSS